MESVETGVRAARRRCGDETSRVPTGRVVCSVSCRNGNRINWAHSMAPNAYFQVVPIISDRYLASAFEVAEACGQRVALVAMGVLHGGSHRPLLVWRAAEPAAGLAANRSFRSGD